MLERVAPIMKMVEAAAATDPAITDLWPNQEDPRLTVQTATATSLVGKPGARTDLTVERAADILFGLLSPELFLLLVSDRRWSPADWETWTYQTLLSQLCEA